MADTTIDLQREITATGLLKSVASETQGAPNEIVAAMPGTDFATAAQGAKADSAVQPAALDAALAEAAQFREWFPGGEAKSITDCTPNLKFDWPHADETNHTVDVLPFCSTGDPDGDNSDKAGRVVIPPYVDHDGERFTVVGVAGGSYDDANTRLTAIVAPTTVTNIGGSAFCACHELATVSFPAVTSIGEGAFEDCTSLTSVSFPFATTIVSGAFEFCSSLTSVSLPAATTIGGNAFDDCTALTSVDFGAIVRTSVPTLSSSAFPDISQSGHTCRIIVPDGQFTEWTTNQFWAALVSQGYQFVRWSDTQPTTKEYVDSGLAGKQDAIADLAAIRSGAALGATSVQPGQRNLLDYATGTTLSPATAVYRTSATLSGTDATIPTPDATAIPTASAYFCFEMEVSVDATATSIAGPGGWTWLDGGELPASGFAGATLYIAARLDCTTRSVQANVWRVEEAAQ